MDSLLKKKLENPSVMRALASSEHTQPSVTIYTDGACQGNPGPGGWGAVFIFEDIVEDMFGGEPQTTNNRMEMMAALKALEALPKHCTVDLYTDSIYVRDGLNTWMTNWKRNGWLTADKKPVKNQDLWKALDAVQKQHTIRWHWVKGHNGDTMNERADDLARSAVVREAFKELA